MNTQPVREVAGTSAREQGFVMAGAWGMADANLTKKIGELQRVLLADAGEERVQALQTQLDLLERLNELAKTEDHGGGTGDHDHTHKSGVLSLKA